MPTSKEYASNSTVIPISNAVVNIKSIILLPQPNILINNKKPPRACIADFGLCTLVSSMSLDPTRAADAGTAGYMAPELFCAGAEASKEADMYAFGMVVYEVITGAWPFGLHHARLALIGLTLRGERPSRPED